MTIAESSAPVQSDLVCPICGGNANDHVRVEYGELTLPVCDECYYMASTVFMRIYRQGFDVESMFQAFLAGWRS